MAEKLTRKEKRQLKRTRRKNLQHVSNSYLKRHVLLYPIAYYRYLKLMYHENLWLRNILNTTYIATTLVLTVGSLYLSQTLTESAEKATGRTSVLQVKSDAATKSTTKNSDKLSTITSANGLTSFKKANDALNDLFDDMYSFTSSSNYAKNRTDAMKYFDTTRVTNLDSVYSTGLDSSGKSIIDNLGMHSQLQNVSIMRTSEDSFKQSTDDEINLTVFVTCQSYIEKSSETNSSREATTVYTIRWNKSINKIVGMSQGKNYVNMLGSGE